MSANEAIRVATGAGLAVVETRVLGIPPQGEIPPPGVRQKLKDAGWRWNPERLMWLYIGDFPAAGAASGPGEVPNGRENES